MNMKTMALTLWDLLKSPDPQPIATSQKPRPIQAKYDAIVETILMSTKDCFGSCAQCFSWKIHATNVSVS